MTRLRSEGLPPVLEAHLSKYRKLMPALTLIFHLVDSDELTKLTEGAFGSSGSSSPRDISPEFRVSLEAARRAAAWCEFLELHARKVFAGLIQPDLQAAHLLLAKIREARVKDGMSVRDIYRHQWTALSRPEDVEAALVVLEETGWVRTETIPTEGRSQRVIRLHPSLVREDGDA